MVRNGRLETNSKTITEYIWNVINNSYSEENGEVIQIHMDYYDMNSQSTTIITFNNKDSIYDYLSYKLKTPGLLSKELLGSFLEQILARGNDMECFSYNNYEINISFKNLSDVDLKYKRIIVDLFYNTSNISSLLLKEQIIYLQERFPKEMSVFFPKEIKRTFKQEYEQQLFFCSLNHKKLLEVVDYICDDDLCDLFSRISKDKFCCLRKKLTNEDAQQKLIRSKTF